MLDRTPQTWTVERENMLRDLWSTGLSCSQIADKLGGVSRSAIIGKAHRLDLPARAVRLSDEEREARQKQSRARETARKALHRLRKRIAMGERVPPRIAPEPIPESIKPLHVNLLELEPYQCRWPYGEGPYTFCGHLKRGDPSYCGFHARLVYQPKGA